MSEARNYYVYALKDSLLNPARPFYIGKGTGIRAWEHELSVDSSAKGQRISKIHAAGKEVLVTKLVDFLTEIEALRLEAEIISAFGIESSGGMLTNAVSPKLNPENRRQRNLNIPSGTTEKAQIGLRLLQDYLSWSVLGLLMREGRMIRVENKRHKAQVR